MRITVDLEDDILQEVMTLTGEKGKSPAVAKAVTEFIQRRKAREFGRMIREGVFDYPSEQSVDLANPIPPHV